jgi:hypothetical protein
MGGNRAAVPAGLTATQGWSPASSAPGGAHRDSVRTAHWYPMGGSTPETGLRQWHDVLATTARLASGRDLGAYPSDASGLPQRTWCDRLVAGGTRFG